MKDNDERQYQLQHEQRANDGARDESHFESYVLPM